jgi:hypothetical protein
MQRAISVIFILRLLTAFLLTTVAVSNAGADERGSYGFVNGTIWKELSESERRLYVTGMVEGFFAAGGAQIELIDKCGCRYEDIANGVTAFFNNNPAYVRFPVSFAVKLHLWKATGVSQNAIDAEAARMAAAMSKSREEQ